MGESIKISRNEDIVIIKLNRPKYFNAFDLELAKDFSDELFGIAKDDKIRGVIVS